MSDPTEQIRRAQIQDMPRELVERVEAGEEVWSTDELREQFTVTGFMAPYVVVRRKADGVVGTLQFTHSPRLYFGWEADE